MATGIISCGRRKAVCAGSWNPAGRWLTADAHELLMTRFMAAFPLPPYSANRGMETSRERRSRVY
jgi:hypothetical protein